MPVLLINREWGLYGEIYRYRSVNTGRPRFEIFSVKTERSRLTSSVILWLFAFFAGPIIGPNITYGLLTKCEVKMAGYWPRSFFAC